MTLNSSAKSAAFCALLTLFVITAVAFAGQIFDFRWETLLRDSQGTSFWDGRITTIGVVIMASAGVVSAWTAVVHPRYRVVFGLAAVFALVFAYDDFYRFHESHTEYLVYIVYGIAFLFLYFVVARLQNRLIIWPLAITLACFGASVLIDVFWDFVPPLGFLERGAGQFGY